MSCCRTCPASRHGSSRRLVRRAARCRARALLDERAGGAHGGAPRDPVPVVQTFHALGASSAATRARADTSPPQRVRLERGRRPAGQRGDRHVHRRGQASCAARAPGGPDLRRAVRGGRDLFTPGRPAPRPRRAAPGAVASGRLVPRKGVDTVIAAIGRVPRRRSWSWPAARPRDQLDDDPEVRRLLRWRRRVGVGRPGRVQRPGRCTTRLPALMRSADVVVCRALVRAVRHRAAGGHGLRRAGGRVPRSAACSTPWSTASPACWSRRATRAHWPTASGTCSPTRRAASSSARPPRPGPGEAIPGRDRGRDRGRVRRPAAAPAA